MFPISASESKEARRNYLQLKNLLQSGITVEEYLMPRGYVFDYKKSSIAQKTNKKTKEYFTSLPVDKLAPKTYYSFNRLMENCPNGFFTEDKDPFKVEFK